MTVDGIVDGVGVDVVGVVVVVVVELCEAVEVELVAKKNCPTEETCAEAVGGKVKMKILFPKMKIPIHLHPSLLTVYLYNQGKITSQENVFVYNLCLLYLIQNLNLTDNICSHY